MTEGAAYRFVGVDGGGTRCRALVIDGHGVELAMAEGPSALVRVQDPGGAVKAIAETVRKAMDVAGASPPAAALWAGLAGAGQPGAREAVEIALRSFGLARRVQVGTDVEAAHMDAFGGGPGVLLLVGTGSQVWGRDPKGEVIRVGGWGGMLADEGSGYWMGLHGLKAVLRGEDGRGPATSLKRAILSTLSISDPEELVPWVAEASKGAVAALAPLVLAAAHRGDEAASGLVHEATGELRLYLEVVRDRWAPVPGPIPMALAGGLVEGREPFRVLLAELVEEVGGVLVPDPVIPMKGAAALARELQTG